MCYKTPFLILFKFNIKQTIFGNKMFQKQENIHGYILVDVYWIVLPRLKKIEIDEKTIHQTSKKYTLRMFLGANETKPFSSKKKSEFQTQQPQQPQPQPQPQPHPQPWLLAFVCSGFFLSLFFPSLPFPLLN